jgi:predicted kinase
MAKSVPEAAILIGIQGSGKTTFYSRRLIDTHLRLSLDLLKTREREAAFLAACLAAGQSFAVDNTNVLAAERARYIEPSKAAGFRVLAYFLRPNVRRSIALNKKREGRKPVPVYGVLRAYKRLEPPSPDEGFDDILAVDIGEDDEFVVEPWRGD